MIKLFVSQFKRYFIFYLLGIITLVITHWSQANLPIYAKELGELAIANRLNEAPLLLYFFIAIIIIVFRTSSRLLFFYPARVMQRDLCVDLINQLENVPPARYKELNTGQIFQTVHKDLSEVRALFGFVFLQICNMAIALSIIIPRLATFNPKLLKALLPLLLAFIIFSVIITFFRKYFKQTLDYQGDVQNFLIESYNGKQVIKNYSKEKSFISLFTKLNLKELNAFYKSGVGTAFSVPLNRLGFGVALIWGAWIIRQEGMPETSFILYSGFLFLLLEPLMFVSWIGIMLARSFSAWERIKKLKLIIEKPSLLECQLNLKNKMSIFDYKNRNYRICTPFWEKDININFSQYQWTALVGETGCGKSYIISHVASVLKDKGKKISMSSQDPHFYDDTIENNLFLGKKSNSDDFIKLQELFNIFELYDIRDNLKKLLKLKVGENGKKLSGGQKKRLSLVRTILSDAEILIWDDPFSSIDLMLEKKIVDNVTNSKIFTKKTIMITTHRFSTIKYCEKIIMLENNNGIVEEKSYQEIISGDGRINEFFKKQMV